MWFLQIVAKLLIGKDRELRIRWNDDRKCWMARLVEMRTKDPRKWLYSETSISHADLQDPLKAALLLEQTATVMNYSIQNYKDKKENYEGPIL